MDAKSSLESLKAVLGLVKDDLAEGRTDDEMQAHMCDLAQRLGIKNAGVFNPLRAAVTGLQVSPPPFSCIHLLGEEKTYSRIERAIGILEREVEKNV